MLKKIFQSALATVCILSVATLWAASAPDTKLADKANNIFSEDTQSFAITAKHAEFTLKLKSNPTTGFTWFLREYDPRLLTPIKRTFVAPTGKLIGAPGYELWTFRVKPEGFTVPQQTMLRMVYSRPWQSDSSTQLLFKVSTSAN